MKRIIFLMMIMIMLTGCSSDDREQSEGYPYVQYQHSIWTYDSYNKVVEVPDGYILNQGYSYDIVETKNGYDIIFHFVKE